MTQVVVTRIDLTEKPDKTVFVCKYPEGWTAKSHPVSRYDVTHMTFDEMKDWLKGDGWTVREWPGGARAWMGKAEPIRERWEILKLRRKYSEKPYLLPQGAQLCYLDFALDL